MHLRHLFLSFLLGLCAVTSAKSQPIGESQFRSAQHPRIFVTAADRDSLMRKIQSTPWASQIYEQLKREVDPIVAIHTDNPTFVISRMQMHWEEGRRYTRFYTDNTNFIPRREGNAKYPTVRLTYGRAASNSTPLPPLDKLLPYGDGSLVKPRGQAQDIVKWTDTTVSIFSRLGNEEPYDIVPFNQTGLGTETVHRAFVHLAWKSAVLYYFTADKRYAKLSADILWVFARGAAQQEQVNPDQEGGVNGFLSWETLGDTRHFSTFPLAYDMIHDYLRDEYFVSDQFKNGIPGQAWAPAHTEGRQWAMRQFEVMFKKEIDNKLTRGGALRGNWNMNEQQSAMLFALALDADSCYADGKGRAWYVDRLLNGPTTGTHGAYRDVLRANISPTTGLWPEAPAGYGQGSIGQLVRFGYVYYRNGIDLLSSDTLLQKATGSMRQMLFPNGYTTNVGDASYSRMNAEPLELMMAYWHDKGDEAQVQRFAELTQYVPQRPLDNEFYYSLFFYLPQLPQQHQSAQLARTSHSKVYSLIFERNMAADARDALAFTLDGFGHEMGHRQPNGMNMELYGRGHVLAPDQGIGADYWSRDTHEYKINVAGHNTVSPNGKGADNDMPQELDIVHCEPAIIDGGQPAVVLSPNHQYVEAANRFYTKEVKADQRRLMAIVRTSPQTGYYVDIFRSRLVDGSDRYHDYIYHNMGIGSEVTTQQGIPMPLSAEPLDSASGKGYSFFTTQGATPIERDLRVDFDLGVDSVHMRMFLPAAAGRTLYQLQSPACHRHYLSQLKQTPVPAVLLRQQGEAWTRPFAAVFEPYGNGAAAQIDGVSELTTKDGEGLCLTVSRQGGLETDRIYYGSSATPVARYGKARFQGVYGVVTTQGKQLQQAYLCQVTSYKDRHIKLQAATGKPVDVYLYNDHGRWRATATAPVSITVDGKKITAKL